MRPGKNRCQASTNERQRTNLFIGHLHSPATSSGGKLTPNASTAGAGKQSQLTAEIIAEQWFVT
jgi:hypothetical protein